METCANIKLSFFLHVLISLIKISFNIARHGMDLIMEVLPPWVVDMRGLMTLDDTSPNVEKEKYHNQPSSSSTPTKKTLV
jgi:hypothetical protein